ncbi:MFS transporter [bacterium SCSIO 12827]|nr:MFS transporter [bacterium SCSIO 12827]
MSEVHDGRLTGQFYDLATGDEDARLCRDIPEEQCREQPVNFLAQTAAQALSKTGDALADTKVVLPWLLGTMGAPAAFAGLLVPIRESLALMPQILVGGVIRQFPRRKAFWAVASIAQGACILAMAGAAVAGLEGMAAGWTVTTLVVLFSLARGVASIAAKDVLGKTVSKGRRGRVSGHAATIAGLAAGAVGTYLMLSPAATRPDWLLYALVAGAGICWFVAAAVYLRIVEHPGAVSGGRGINDLVREQVSILAKDRQLQRFLATRALMISTALVGPLYVTLAQQQTGLGLDGLGWLIIASGLSAALSSSFWGILSDRSSRATMALAATIAGALGPVALLALTHMPGIAGSIIFYAAILFVLGVAHAGVRIGRKTHVVDLAGGDRKAEYVALSNTVIGILLLGTGALTGALMGISITAAIGTLSVLALLGAGLAMTMANVQE